MGCLIWLALTLVGVVWWTSSQSSPAPASSTAGSANTQQAAAAPQQPQATDTPTPTDNQWASDASQDTYTEVNDHPDEYQGDKVVWKCSIAKFLGDDANTPGNTDIGCMVHLGEFNDQEIILNVPPEIDTSAMDTGDTVAVYGTVDQPMQGKTVLGADSSWPQIDAVYLDDYRVMFQTPTAIPTAIPTMELIATPTTDPNAPTSY